MNADMIIVGAVSISAISAMLALMVIMVREGRVRQDRCISMVEGTHRTLLAAWKEASSKCLIGDNEIERIRATAELEGLTQARMRAPVAQQPGTMNNGVQLPPAMFPKGFVDADDELQNTM